MGVSILVDIAAILILVVACLIGTKNGFIRSVVNLGASLLSAVIAFFLCGPVASFVYDVFIGKSVTDGIAASGQGGLTNIITGLQDILSKIPLFLSDGSGAASQAQSVMQSMQGKSVEEIIAAISTTVIKPMAVSGISILTFVVIFFIVRLLLKFVTRIVTAILEKTPFLGGINSFLGGVFGVVQGLLILVLISILLKMAFTYTPQLWILTPQVIEDTFAFKHLYHLNILEIIKDCIL